MPVVKISTNRRVTIPKAICDVLGLREGQFVEVTRRNGVIVIKPTDIAEPDDILTPADKASLRRGLAQVKRGESIPWDEVKKRLKL
ncbi:MAG: AbrB/MazE/SpoVT family DNA-binding domain-containing protein [Candidatus Bipolaricaulota bacterium]|nr:AbrB/MazE/SpoVT family DNA-binding domain-containing protein [Candidatus Bipolaricaulota bacterium]